MGFLFRLLPSNYDFCLNRIYTYGVSRLIGPARHSSYATHCSRLEMSLLSDGINCPRSLTYEMTEMRGKKRCLLLFISLWQFLSRVGGIFQTRATNVRLSLSLSLSAPNHIRLEQWLQREYRLARNAEWKELWRNDNCPH